MALKTRNYLSFVIIAKSLSCPGWKRPIQSRIGHKGLESITKKNSETKKKLKMQLNHTEIKPYTSRFTLVRLFRWFKQEINKVIVGQEAMVEDLLTGLLTKGHILLEGFTRVGKDIGHKNIGEYHAGAVLTASSLPDLLPSDVVGTMVYHAQQHTFTVRRDLFSPISCWQMKSTGHLPKYRALCWKPCRNDKWP